MGSSLGCVKSCIVCFLTELSCESAGFMSCCTGDNCVLESAGMPSCSCDAQCFESGDCCSDVAEIDCHPGIIIVLMQPVGVFWYDCRGKLLCFGKVMSLFYVQHSTWVVIKAWFNIFVI